jgi:hypothetical protein
LRPVTRTENASVAARASTNATSLASSMAIASQRPSADMPTPSGDRLSATDPVARFVAASRTSRRSPAWSLT